MDLEGEAVQQQKKAPLRFIFYWKKDYTPPEYKRFIDCSETREAKLTKTGLVQIIRMNTKNRLNGQLINEFQAHQGQVFCLTWKSPPSNNLIATCGKDRKTKIWKELYNRWEEIKVFQCTDTIACDIQWAPNSFTLAIGHQNGRLDLVEGDNFKITNTKAFNQEFISLDWLRNTNEQVLITGGRSEYQNLIRIWNVLSDKQTILDKVFEFKVDDFINCIRFAPLIFDNQIQAAVCADNFMQILTMQYNQPFIKPITVIQQQKINLAKQQTLDWSILGTAFIANAKKKFRQNEKNEFLK